MELFKIFEVQWTACPVTLLCQVKDNNILHEMWFYINDRLNYFDLKEFELIMNLNCTWYLHYLKYLKVMKKDEIFVKRVTKKKYFWRKTVEVC